MQDIPQLSKGDRVQQRCVHETASPQSMIQGQHQEFLNWATHKNFLTFKV